MMIFVSFSIEKIKSPALTVPPLSHLTSYTPTNSNLYLAYSLVAVVNLTNTVSLHSKYQILCPFSIASVIPQHQSRSKAHVCVRNKRVVSTSPQPQTGGPPLVNYLQLLIQYIHRYPHIGGHSSIRNLRMHHAMVTGSHLSWQSQQ